MTKRLVTDAEAERIRHEADPFFAHELPGAEDVYALLDTREELIAALENFVSCSCTVSKWDEYEINPLSWNYCEGHAILAQVRGE
jgi:hypothetical protein